MPQKRCLNCRHYIPDDLSLEGNPIEPDSFPYAGLCIFDGKRVKDGWSCGKWTAKETRKRTE